MITRPSPTAGSASWDRSGTTGTAPPPRRACGSGSCSRTALWRPRARLPSHRHSSRPGTRPAFPCPSTTRGRSPRSRPSWSGCSSRRLARDIHPLPRGIPLSPLDSGRPPTAGSRRNRPRQLPPPPAEEDEGPQTMSQTAPAQRTTTFVRDLSVFDATMIVAGSMIGSGIFIVSADIARQVGSPFWLLMVWAATGVMTVVAALSYGELAAMYPRAGGQYLFLREAFGPLPGFLYGWTLFLVIQTGTIAAVAVAFAKFLGAVVPWISAGHRLVPFVLGGSVGSDGLATGGLD